jgi:hypothetical protein
MKGGRTTFGIAFLYMGFDSGAVILELLQECLSRYPANLKIK